MRLTHKDSSKLRGVPLSLVLSIVRTPTFANRGCTDDTARAVVSNLKLSVKRELRSRGSTTGRARYGSPRRPGTIWLSIFTGEHPARVASFLLHEMIHGVLGLPHGQEFDECLWRAANSLWGVEAPKGGRWTHVYEADHELDMALLKSGLFDHLVPAHTIDPQCAKVDEKFWKKAGGTDEFQEFSHGDRVTFVTKYGRREGVIVRINKKRFSIKVEGHSTNWLIPGRMLSHA